MNVAPRPHTTCLLTFDYELFHGRNYATPGEVLFEPTERILELCRRLDVQTTFFPDVCSAWWHREHDRMEFVERFERQLCRALAAGHDVQLHLHPHWLNCRPDGDSWQVDTAAMFPHEFGWGSGADNAPAIIRRGIEYLENLLRPVDDAYRCTGFRAASLALQPDESQFLEALWDAGIRLDCSVTPHVRTETGTFTLDYRHVPAAANWRMAPASGLAAADSGILEVPIATFRSSKLDRAAFVARRARAFRDRRGEPIARAKQQSRVASLAQLLRMNLRYVAEDPWFTLSCDTKGFDAEMILDGLESVIERHRGEEKIALSLISHPKLMFDDQLHMLHQFIVGARRRFGGDFAFGTATSVLASFGPGGRDEQVQAHV